MPELITVVPPTARPTGVGIAGRPSAIVRPAVAVERRERRERLVGVAAPVHVRARLEHDDVEAGLGEDRRRDRAAGARADDRHVALLAARRAGAGRRGPSRAVGAGDAVGDLAAHLVADRRPHPRVVAVAEAREDLEEQQQVAGARNARALEPAQEVLARLEAGAAEAPRERQPVEDPQRELDLPARCARGRLAR